MKHYGWIDLPEDTPMPLAQQQTTMYPDNANTASLQALAHNIFVLI
ncbi:hypothetical protein [Emticicia sp. 17c]